MDSIKPQGRLTVLCRPARETDTSDVMELTSTIWEGDDYVPEVWATWLADPHGLLAVAERDGRVVGLSKLSRLTTKDWWLEGLRVDPAFEGRGIAAQLHDFLLDYWKKTGKGTLRLATASFRYPVQHLCERTGFHKAAEFTPFVAPALPESVASFRPLSPAEAPGALAFAHQSSSLEFSAGLIDLDWSWAALAESHLTEAAGQSAAWWWQEAGDPKAGLLLAAREVEGEKESRANIRLLACRVDRIAACLQDYRRLAATQGFSQARWIAPLHPGMSPALEEAGFHRDWDASVYVYALE